MAQALTKIAQQIEAAEHTALQRHLDNPTPFTVKSVGSLGAHKDTEAEVSSLAAWKKYRVLLNRVDTSKAQDIDWPDLP